MAWSELFSSYLSGSCGCPDYDSPNIGEFDLSWKHWPDQMDGTSNFVNIANRDLFELTSDGPCMSKKRCPYGDWPSPAVLDHDGYLPDQVFICAGMP